MTWLKKILLWALLVSMVLFCALEFGLSLAARGRLFTNIEDVPYNKTALLLGTTKYDTLGSHTVLPYYRHRINAALQLYHAGKVSYILVSSINAREDNVSLIREDLIAGGVPPERIYLDFFGLKTYDSIIRCGALYDTDSITIVTQRHHCQRALFIARQKGVDAIGYQARGDGDEFSFGTITHEFKGRILMLWKLATNHRPSYMGEKPIIH